MVAYKEDMYFDAGILLYKCYDLLAAELHCIVFNLKMSFKWCTVFAYFSDRNSFLEKYLLGQCQALSLLSHNNIITLAGIGKGTAGS